LSDPQGIRVVPSFVPTAEHYLLPRMCRSAVSIMLSESSTMTANVNK